MQFKQIAAIVASCVALGNAVAFQEPAADQGLALELAAPNNILARSLDQQVKQVRRLQARADQAEEAADRLQTREAEDAAIEARQEHLDHAKLVRRALMSNLGYHNNFDGLDLEVRGIHGLKLGSRQQVNGNQNDQGPPSQRPRYGTNGH
ncbi:hypothetical protein CLAFUW4_10592 [Fulvia fulva]|uniref:Uncharacterized protein n=1 Tax=Passalora fulva TaxID=5499 RepID=A0A9Q8LFF0_PASFU|nr:uncharacterized protein CLAFUR5_05206 [Fulvia fulva]KAK4616020.1 hypothetical protein CLAFUR4_10597 [Fulvia fulva]KAK4616637.1 hypothetical protein CLAFUR0_10647 [Fulvia fulva]UJO16405.1 hypothetical protein CLAFUR5_05206 [Fulvia fulva]WPV18813.1 hypothetical protein CLAFUW4_10592 [Fulvia fulva]WPV34625.1 hypothetical protein CLAFUW7_10594 [Fulvia fulva]